MRIKNIVHSLSIALSITLVGGLLPAKVANADSLSYAMKPSILANKVLTQEETSQIESEIDILKNCRVDTSVIKRVDVTESGNEYILQYKDIDEKVIIENSDTESTTIISSDGENTNVISFENDGSIILDGFKVQISEPEMDTNPVVTPSPSVVTPYGPIYKSVKSLTPYGSLKSSDYNKYLNSGKQNIALGKALDTLTATTLATLISYTNPYVGILVSLASVAANVKAVLNAVNPKTEYLGCAWTTYTCGAEDYEYNNKFYANTACTGTYKLELSYEHFTVY